MLFKLFIICILILAGFYYFSIMLQCLFPESFRITTLDIKFLKAIIPFYYWIADGKKKTEKKINSNNLNNFN